MINSMKKPAFITALSRSLNKSTPALFPAQPKSSVTHTFKIITRCYNHFLLVIAKISKSSGNHFFLTTPNNSTHFVALLLHRSAYTYIKHLHFVSETRTSIVLYRPLRDAYEQWKPSEQEKANNDTSKEVVQNVRSMGPLPVCGKIFDHSCTSKWTGSLKIKS